MKNYGEQANLPLQKRHFHTLKHSIAVHLLNGGVDLRCPRMARPHFAAEYRHLSLSRIGASSKAAMSIAPTPRESPAESLPGNHPNLEDTARLFEGPLGIRSIALTGLFILGCFYTLYFARDFFLPVMLAIVLNFLFAPLVRLLSEYKVPRALGAALVIAAVIAVVGSLVYELSGPLAEWVEKAPATGAKLQAKIKPLRLYMEKLSTTSEQIEKLATTKPESGKAVQPVELKRTSLLGALFSGTSKFVFSLLVVIVLLFFLLASGDLFLTKLVHVLPTLSDKKKAVRTANRDRREYFGILIHHRPDQYRHRRLERADILGFRCA